MKHIALLLVLACTTSACGDSPKDASGESAPSAASAMKQDVNASASTPRTEPITIDKGDGCTVVIREEGRGRGARIGDEVTLDYVARVKDSETPFASTSNWNERCRIGLGKSDAPGVVPGFARGLEGLKAGSKATITVPPALAYGKAGLPSSGIPSDATLVFDVEVMGVGR
jgi:FKBP-type peptidyl-prolyl cis-trans isomerase